MYLELGLNQLEIGIILLFHIILLFYNLILQGGIQLFLVVHSLKYKYI